MRKPNGYWTKERCHEEALKYETKTNFRKNSGSASVSADKNVWMDEICSHMRVLKIRKKYWTKEKCHELALKYNNRTDFHDKHRRAYNVASKNKWLDDIFSHMTTTNMNNRCIYAYEFPDGHAYIGLTYNLQNRYNRHMNDRNSSLNIHMKETKLNPIVKQLTDYIPIDESREKEKFYVEKYKKEGWNILNKATTGSLGGITIYWSKERCQEVALLCKTKSEFEEKYVSAYGASRKNKWIKEICSHMKNKRKDSGYWNNYNNCLNEAKLRRTIKNFNVLGSGAYNSCVKNNWIDKIYSDMNWKRNKRKF